MLRPLRISGEITGTRKSASEPSGVSHPVRNRKRARPGGFEPPTYGLEVRCSIQLSYGRVWVSSIWAAAPRTGRVGCRCPRDPDAIPQTTASATR